MSLQPSTTTLPLAARLRHISSCSRAVLLACVLAVASLLAAQTAHATSMTLSPSAGSLPPGQVGSQVGVLIDAGGNTGQVTFSIIAGSLPGGLSLIGASQHAAFVSGLPTT